MPLPHHVRRLQSHRFHDTFRFPARVLLRRKARGFHQEENVRSEVLAQSPSSVSLGHRPQGHGTHVPGRDCSGRSAHTPLTGAHRTSPDQQQYCKSRGTVEWGASRGPQPRGKRSPARTSGAVHGE